MTARTLTAPRSGPVALSVDLPAGAVNVYADPAFTVAEVTVTALGDDAALRDAVRDATLRWEEHTGSLTVRVRPPAAAVTVTGSGRTVFGNHATTIVQSFDVIDAGASVTGLVIDGVIGGNVVNAGGRVVVNGAEVSGGTVIGGRIEVTVHVPEGSTVAAWTRSAPLSAAGEYAEVDFFSVSGDLTVGGTGALRAKTTSGDISAAVVDGTAAVRSVSGAIRLGRADDVHAESTSGDITVRDFAGRAALTTVSGDMRVRATEGGTVTARSVSGDVMVIATDTALAEGLTVSATSRTGRVFTPAGGPPGAASAVRARRPRRTGGGA